MTQANRKCRVGVYVCHCGGNISDVVDVERVAEAAGKLGDVVVARHEMFMCSDPGQKLIADDIQKEGLDRVVVAACSPSLHEQTFRGTLRRAGLNPFLYEHVNLREQVSWCHHDDRAGATPKASRLLAAAVAKTRRLVALEPVIVKADRSVAVIGGGIAGLRTALDLARGGFQVHVVERASELGGKLLRPGHLYPSGERAVDLLGKVLAEVASNRSITVHTEAEVIARAGYLGNFRLSVRTKAGRTQELRVGAVVVATGFEDYRPAKGEFGWGLSDRVITLPELIARLDPKGPTGGRLTIEGSPVRRMAFIHCVGSRQLEGVHTPPEGGCLHQHCSRVCCTATLWAASQVRTRFPETDVFDIYQDIRTYGRGQEDIHEAAARNGVVFLRYAGDSPPKVEVGPDGAVTVEVVDSLSFGEELAVPADLLVLVTGMVPRDIGSLVDMFKLSRSADGFLQEVHPKLRPVESRVDGVFITGTCQAPMDAGETTATASAAASKAAALLCTGEISLAPFVASIDPSLCDGCGDCVKECAHVNAITLPEGAKVPEINTAICKGCGMCVAVCTHRALEVHGWNLKQFEVMVDIFASPEVVNG
jgi:heterodisulfide reductase subunit A